MNDREKLDKLMADRPGWHKHAGHWEKSDYSEPGVVHTRRTIWAWPTGRLGAYKVDGVGRPTDDATFDDVEEAIAWVEAPRSEEPIHLRAEREVTRRYLERNNVELDGLKGKRIQSGRNPKDQHFDVIDFDGHRVRITNLGEWRYRIACNRKTETVQAAEENAKRAVADAVRRLTGREAKQCPSHAAPTPASPATADAAKNPATPAEQHTASPMPPGNVPPEPAPFPCLPASNAAAPADRSPVPAAGATPATSTGSHTETPASLHPARSMRSPSNEPSSATDRTGSQPPNANRSSGDSTASASQTGASPSTSTSVPTASSRSESASDCLRSPQGGGQRDDA